MGRPAGDAMTRESGPRFETRAIHDGQEPEPEYGAVNVPIFQTSTYAQPKVGEPRRFDYGRSGNPTREALQQAIASLEGASSAFGFASGLAAETTLMLTLSPGDHVVLGDDVYGGTYRLLSRVMGRWGVRFDPVDLTDLEALASAMRPETRLVWVETPTNPLLKVVDIAAAAEIAHGSGARCAVDNAIATFLERHPSVAAVHYPGLESHPGHDVARKQMGDFGGMVSFQVATAEEAIRVAERTRLFFLAESLGGVESLIEVPCPMTHASVTGSPLEVPGNLIRLSVGIEHPDDLIEDLAQALG